MGSRRRCAARVAARYVFTPSWIVPRQSWIGSSRGSTSCWLRLCGESSCTMKEGGVSCEEGEDEVISSGYRITSSLTLARVHDRLEGVCSFVNAKIKTGIPAKRSSCSRNVSMLLCGRRLQRPKRAGVGKSYRLPSRTCGVEDRIVGVGVSVSGRSSSSTQYTP